MVRGINVIPPSKWHLLFAHTHMHTHTHNTCTHTRTHTHTHTHSDTHKHTHTFRHTQPHTLTHIHTLKHTLTLWHNTHTLWTQHTISSLPLSTSTPTPIRTTNYAAPHQQVIAAVKFCICIRLSSRLNLYSSYLHWTFRGFSQSCQLNSASDSATPHSPSLPNPCRFSIHQSHPHATEMRVSETNLYPSASQHKGCNCRGSYNNICGT